METLTKTLNDISMRLERIESNTQEGTNHLNWPTRRPNLLIRRKNQIYLWNDLTVPMSHPLGDPMRQIGEKALAATLKGLGTTLGMNGIMIEGKHIIKNGSKGLHPEIPILKLLHLLVKLM